MRTTNAAYGDADRQSLFITEAEQGVILKARLPVPGHQSQAKASRFDTLAVGQG